MDGKKIRELLERAWFWLIGWCWPYCLKLEVVRPSYPDSPNEPVILQCKACGRVIEW